MLLLAWMLLASPAPPPAPPLGEVGALTREIRSIRPDDEDFSDLLPLREAIGSARVVQLGEVTHADGTAFEAKARLVRFLTREMGFDAIAWESGVFDVALVDQALRGTSPVHDAARGIYPGWSDSAEILSFLTWIRQSKASPRPVELVGIDPRVTSGQNRTAQFPQFVFAFFDRVDKSLLSDKDRADFVAWSTALLSPQTYEKAQAAAPLRPEIARRLLSVLDSRGSDFAKHASPRDIDFLRRCLTTLLALEQHLATRHYAGSRNAQMAESFLWHLAGRLRDRKIIVWAHNTHIAEGAIGEDESDTEATADDPSLGPVTGTVLARALGEDLYTVGLTSYQGTTRMDGRPGDPTAPVPAPPADSLEAALHAVGKPYLFLDLHGLPPDHRLRQSFTAGFVFYMPIKCEWAKAYDGVLFIDSMRASTAWDNKDTRSE